MDHNGPKGKSKPASRLDSKKIAIGAAIGLAAGMAFMLLVILLLRII